MPMVGMGIDAVMRCANGLGDRFEHDGEGAGLGDRARVRLDCRPLLAVAPLRLEAADDVHRLGRQADVGHDRNAAVDEVANGFRHAAAALDLNGATVGLFHYLRAVSEGDGRALLVGAERHVDDDKGAPGTADNRAPVHDHQFEGDRNGCLVAMHNHSEAVANEKEVAVAVGDGGRMRMVGGQRDDRLPALLHRRDIGRHQALLGAVHGHDR